MEVPLRTDDQALAAAKKRNPLWRRLGIEVSRVTNRTQGKKYSASWLVVIPAKVVGDGRGRERRQFKTYSEALRHAESKAELKRNSGARGFVLSDKQREDAAEAWPILAQLGMGFLDAAKLAMKHLRPASGEITFRALSDIIVKEKQREKIRPASLQSLKWHLGQLCGRFGSENGVKTVSKDEFSRWIHELEESGVGDRHQKNLIRYSQQFFRYAVDHGYRADSPAALVKPPRIDWKPPAILSVDEARRLLSTALQEEFRDMLPSLVLQLFVGGIRSGEVERLAWTDIDLDQRKVSIEPSVGKNRRAGDWRFPVIPDNALAFLLLHGERKGPVTPARFKKRLTAFHKAAGFKAWDETHDNAKRHSFGSYGCKLHGQVWVQDQMGHNTSATFLRFYRNAKVTKEEASAYYGLTPANITAPQLADVLELRAAGL